MKHFEKMPFGKHKGEDFEDIPTQYLDWLLGLEDLSEQLRETVVEHLESRSDWDGILDD